MEGSPHIRSRFIVLITRGLRANVHYASAPNRESAELLRKDAVKMGYKDATVIAADKLFENRRSTARSEADQGSVNR